MRLGCYLTGLEHQLQVHKMLGHIKLTKPNDNIADNESQLQF